MKLHWPAAWRHWHHWNQWRHWWHRQSRTTLLAMVLGGLTVLVLLCTPMVDREGIQAQQALDQQRQRIQRNSTSRPSAPDPLDQVQSYLSTFPPLQQNAADIATLFDSAARHDVVLLHGDYQYKRMGNTPWVTYSATFPVHGDYRAIREFAADVLEALPHAALEELRMSRPAAASAVLDTVVHFNLVYRRP